MHNLLFAQPRGRSQTEGQKELESVDIVVLEEFLIINCPNLAQDGKPCWTLIGRGESEGCAKTLRVTPRPGWRWWTGPDWLVGGGRGLAPRRDPNPVIKKVESSPFQMQTI